jgi:hypothetical protein
VFDAFEESHGRLVRRRVFLSSATQGLVALEGWPDLRAVLTVETIRSITGDFVWRAEPVPRVGG